VQAMDAKIPITNSVTNPKVHFYFVDAIRAIAALWVVVRHTELEERLTTLTSVLPKWLGDFIFYWGGLGVAIFFVLSGFVIAHSTRNAKIDLTYFRRFNLRRFIRLTPPYYASIVVVLGFGLLAAFAKGEPFMPMDRPLSAQRLLAHLFYLQDIFHFKHINDVYWTLCLEVQFYILFCAMLMLSQWLRDSWNLHYTRAILFVPAAIVSALFPMGIFPDNGRPVILLPLWYTFLLGIFAYWAWRDKLNRVFFYAYSTLLLIPVTGQFPSWFTITGVITAVLLLEVGRANLMHLLNWQWLQFLGKISYSLYLTHPPILGAVFFIGYKLFNRSLLSEVICLVLSVTACICFAAIMWQIVEKPSIAWSQKIKLVKKLEATGS
jgi:peptidoglycan/LPS O-acetylase OafA/YrhL